MAATPISPRAQERQKARLAKLEEKWSVLFNQVKSISKKKNMWEIHYPRVRSYGVRVGRYWLFFMMNCLNFDDPSSEYDWVWMYKCRLSIHISILTTTQLKQVHLMYYSDAHAFYVWYRNRHLTPSSVTLYVIWDILTRRSVLFYIS